MVCTHTHDAAASIRPAEQLCAAGRAIEIGALTYGSVRSILDHKVDRHAP